MVRPDIVSFLQVILWPLRGVGIHVLLTYQAYQIILTVAHRQLPAAEAASLSPKLAALQGLDNYRYCGYMFPNDSSRPETALQFFSPVNYRPSLEALIPYPFMYVSLPCVHYPNPPTLNPLPETSTPKPSKMVSSHAAVGRHFASAAGPRQPSGHQTF